ncbi:ABC transporter permease [Halopseudomonas litoralis]|uniref:ABC transporter permease n=1 Tax=Halopseudomonas litoralis TaxID=797277 RepID=UPI000B181E68|nr:ABC transporter permease [Halopseudomonas litoralis]
MLVLPLLAFVITFFVMPIGTMLVRSIENVNIIELLPQTSGQLKHWDGKEPLGTEVYSTFASELVQLRENRDIGRLAGMLNQQESGLRSLILGTGRKLDPESGVPAYTQLTQADPRWGADDTWLLLKRLSSRYTADYYLAALDYEKTSAGEIRKVAETRQLYISNFLNTLGLTVSVTLVCLLLGYPVAFLLANTSQSRSNLLMILVLLPFWTSLLVRTTSWIVMLQSGGVVNSTLLSLNLIEEPLQLIFNRIGTVTAMSHILLPFMILPLYSVMKGIDPAYMKAARSLGGNPLNAFIRIYVPQTLPGIGAGTILVFILAIGYYITPALVGGRSGQMIGNFIAYHMQTSLNWGLASALGGILLIVVIGMYWLYTKLVGVNNFKMG